MESGLPMLPASKLRKRRTQIDSLKISTPDFSARNAVALCVFLARCRFPSALLADHRGAASCKAIEEGRNLHRNEAHGHDLPGVRKRRACGRELLFHHLFQGDISEGVVRRITSPARHHDVNQRTGRDPPVVSGNSFSWAELLDLR